MRIDFRRSLLLAAALLLAATLVVTDTNTSPAGALGQGSRATFRRSVDKPSLKIRRKETRRVSRSATRSRASSTRSSTRARTARTRIRPAAVLTGDIWAKLRQCEAGGRYDANSGNGYYGAYQFSAGTWRRLGYSGLPHEAPPEMQDEAARKLQARSGWGQWPACSRRIGAR
jgi:resuscitation-promoting factor RpfB